MFESIKRIFAKSRPKRTDEMALQAQSIEINPIVPVALTRLEARLERLLSIADPSDEIKAEINRLKEI